MYEIHKATRQAIPALIAIWGENGCGKTFTALHLLRGMLGPDEKIAFIDTENKRAQVFANYCQPWDVLDLQPPFTPRRYHEAFQQVENAGYKGCIVDSASHVWMGDGGVLEMKDSGSGKGLGAWRQPKLEYKKMMNALLRSKMHVIFCLRAKEKFQQAADSRGKDQIVSLGYVPDCHKDFLYETMFWAKLDQDTHKAVAVKRPDELADVIAPGKLLGIETGEKIATWLAEGEAFNFDQDKLRRLAREAADRGKDSFTAFWKGLGKPERATVNAIMDELKGITEEVDKRAQEAGNGDDAPEAEESQSGTLSDDEAVLLALVTKEIENAGSVDLLNQVVTGAMARTAECSDAFQERFSEIRARRLEELKQPAGGSAPQSKERRRPFE